VNRLLVTDSANAIYTAYEGGPIQSVQSVLRGLALSVKGFGATGLGVVDDYSAVQTAINTAVASGGHVYFPPGTYLLSAPLVVHSDSNQQAGLELFGSGLPLLQATHSAGPVIRVQRYRTTIRRLAISANSTRINGAAGSNYGILDEPDDTAGAQINYNTYEQLRVINQPSHGIALVCSHKASLIHQCNIADNKGHGVVLDDGNLTSRANKVVVGDVTIRATRIVNNTGHSICAAPTGSATCYRLVIENVDSFFNALAAGVRLSAHDMWLFTQNSNVQNCGIGGFAGTAPRVLTVGGLYINGKHNRVVNNRFIDVLGNAVTCGPDSDGSTVDTLIVTGEVTVPLNPAVVLESGATGVYVRSGEVTNITSLMTPSAANTGNRAEAVGLSPTAYRSRNQEITIADDGVATIAFSGITRGVMVLNGNADTSRSPMVAFRVGDVNAYCKVIGATEANVATTTGVLTGTTGVDTNLTISADSASPTLYIENRRGAALAWMPTFLSLANGEMVL
jgi:hypothetical protein